MPNQLEGSIPVVQSDGLNSAKNGTLSGNITFSGTNTHSGAETFTGGVTLTPSGSTPISIGSSGTGTITSGSVTINAQRGVITTASLTTGTATATTFDIKNTFIGASSQILLTLGGGSNSTGLPVLGQVVTGTSGSATITVVNADSRPAGSALNGTLKVNFLVLS